MRAHIEELERRLRVSLPTDYRDFLEGHHDSLLEATRNLVSPRSGVVDTLLTAEDMLRNDDQHRIGIPEKSLLHIGGNLLGGYLYMSVDENSFGEILYTESYIVRELFASFSEFLSETQQDAA